MQKAQTELLKESNDEIFHRRRLGDKHLMTTLSKGKSTRIDRLLRETARVFFYPGLL